MWFQKICSFFIIIISVCVTLKCTTLSTCRTVTFDKLYSTSIPDLPTVDSPKEPSSIKTVLAFKGLKPYMFAHPLDARISKQLSQIPFLQDFARSLYTIIEQAFVVENLGSSILVGPNQMPLLYKSIVTASKILDIETPDVYVKQNPTPNAYTLAFMGKRPFIVVHTGLLDLLNEKEVLSVLGHELGHLKCEHGVWVTLLNILIESVDALLGPITPLRRLLLQWQRSAEYSCDRASLLVAQDYKVVASVLMKLCGGSIKNDFSKDLNVEAFLDQAKTLEKEQQSLPGRLLTVVQDQVATHPIPVIRVKELVNWSKSAQFSGLMERSQLIKINL